MLLVFARHIEETTRHRTKPTSFPSGGLCHLYHTQTRKLLMILMVFNLKQHIDLHPSDPNGDAFECEFRDRTEANQTE